MNRSFNPGFCNLNRNSVGNNRSKGTQKRNADDVWSFQPYNQAIGLMTSKKISRFSYQNEISRVSSTVNADDDAIVPSAEHSDRLAAFDMESYLDRLVGVEPDTKLKTANVPMHYSTDNGMPNQPMNLDSPVSSVIVRRPVGGSIDSVDPATEVSEFETMIDRLLNRKKLAKNNPTQKLPPAKGGRLLKDRKKLCLEELLNNFVDYDEPDQYDANDGWNGFGHLIKPQTDVQKNQICGGLSSPVAWGMSSKKNYKGQNINMTQNSKSKATLLSTSLYSSYMFNNDLRKPKMNPGHKIMAPSFGTMDGSRSVTGGASDVLEVVNPKYSHLISPQVVMEATRAVSSAHMSKEHPFVSYNN